MKLHRMALGLIGAVIVLAGCGESERPRLTAMFVSGMGYSEEDISALTDAFQKTHREIEVSAFFVPYESQHNAIVASGASRALAYDVVQVDGTWTAEFAEGEYLVDVTARLAGESASDIVPCAMDAFTKNGKLYAMPWLTDCEFLFYSKRMLKEAGFTSPPRTWDELRSQAQAIKKAGIVAYPIIAQWGHGEDLVCDFGCMLFGRGGEFVTAESREPGAGSKAGFAGPAGVDALAFMKRLLDEGLVNPASLEARSDDAQRVLCEGQAAFNVNWVYVYGLANDAAVSKAAGQIEIAPVPGDGQREGVSVGRGMGLGIVARSRMPDKAWEYIRFIASQENQRKYCGTWLPVYRSLYGEGKLPGIGVRVLAVATEQQKGVRNRPSVYYYVKMSSALQDEMQEALRGNREPGRALTAAAERTREEARQKPVRRP